MTGEKLRKEKQGIKLRLVGISERFCRLKPQRTLVLNLVLFWLRLEILGKLLTLSYLIPPSHYKLAESKHH